MAKEYDIMFTCEMPYTCNGRTTQHTTDVVVWYGPLAEVQGFMDDGTAVRMIAEFITNAHTLRNVRDIRIEPHVTY